MHIRQHAECGSCLQQGSLEQVAEGKDVYIQCICNALQANTSIFSAEQSLQCFILQLKM